MKLFLFNIDVQSTSVYQTVYDRPDDFTQPKLNEANFSPEDWTVWAWSDVSPEHAEQLVKDKLVEIGNRFLKSYTSLASAYRFEKD